ncbi:hypothetical protein V8D89_002037 [Ganoderma adspersum]
MFEDIPERQSSTLPSDRMPHLVAVANEKAAIGTCSEDCNEHLRQVHAIFAEFLGAPEDEDFVVEGYLNGTGFGPDRNDMCFSDLKPFNNAWNCTVASELGGILFVRQSSGNWRCSDGTRVTAASQPYWADAQAEEQSKVARKREHRAQHWERQKKVCKAALTMATTTRDFNGIMNKIDVEQWSPWSGYSARGSHPTPRHRQDRINSLDDANNLYVSHHEPISGLLTPFYNEEWLEGCSEDYIKQVSSILEEPFDWVVEIANLYSTNST